MFEKISEYKIVITGMFVAALILSIPFTLVQLSKRHETRSRATGEQVSVILNPLTKSLNTGDNLDINVSINGGTNDISAIDITFTYDQNLLSPESTCASVPCSFTPTSTFSTITNDDSTQGSIHYVGVNPTSNSITGSSISIGSIHLKAKALGSAVVGFSDIHINASGITGSLPIDTNNTQVGTYTVIAQTPPPSTPIPTNGECVPPVACNQVIPAGCVRTEQTSCSCGTIVCPSLTPSISPTDTPTATLTPSGATPSGTSIPTATLSPTSTPVPGNTYLNVSLSVIGIGTNTQVGQNNNPEEAQKTASLLIFDSANNQVSQTQGTLTYSHQTGTFSGNIPLDPQIQSGHFTAKISLDDTLRKLFPGILTINLGSVNQTNPVELISGDLNGDNTLDLSDFNSMLGCYGTQTCNQKTKADLNSDGRVDELDVNILISSFLNRQGD